MTAYDKSNPASIQAMFGAIARRYDRTNALLSLNLHNRWNRQLVAASVSVTVPTSSSAQSSGPTTLLDLCCGTGEIALNFLRDTNLSTPRQAYLLDFCPEMLECAKIKAQKMLLPSGAIHYIQADAQKIPLPDSSVSCATIAYGIRNVCDIQKCLNDTFRVLQAGGTLGILELTRPRNIFLRIPHTLYLKGLMPFIGQCVTSDRAAYKYLCKSIQQFIEPQLLAEKMAAAGFCQISTIPLCGGIATILTAKKP